MGLGIRKKIRKKSRNKTYLLYIDIKKKNHRPILKLFSEGKRVVAPLENEISFDLLREKYRLILMIYRSLLL